MHTFQRNIQGWVLLKYTCRSSWDYSKKLFRAVILQTGIDPSNLDVRYLVQKTQSFNWVLKLNLNVYISVCFLFVCSNFLTAKCKRYHHVSYMQFIDLQFMYALHCSSSNTWYKIYNKLKYIRSVQQITYFCNLEKGIYWVRSQKGNCTKLHFFKSPAALFWNLKTHIKQNYPCSAGKCSLLKTYFKCLINVYFHVIVILQGYLFFGNASQPGTKATGCEILLYVILYSAMSRIISQNKNR